MKKLFFAATIILMISGFWSSTNAQVVDTNQFGKLVEQEQIKELKQKGYNEVEVNVLNIPIQRIEIDNGPISIRINSNGDINQREYKKVDIYVNNNYQRSIGIPVEIKIMENVIVAKNTILKDTVLSRNNVEFKKCNITGIMQKPLTEKDLQSEIIATKMYKSGEILDKRFVKSKPDVIKNAPVTVIFKTDNDLSISIDGRAVTEGQIGSYVSVENKIYKKVYLGRVIGPNKVLVEI